MKETFKEEFRGLFHHTKGVLKGVVSICLFVLVSPIVIMERKFGFVTLLRLRLKRFNIRTSGWDAVMFLQRMRRGLEPVPYMFKNNSVLSMKIFTYYTYQSWRYYHKLSITIKEQKK